MHVACKDEIEFFELFFDGFVRDVDGGVNEHDFGLFLWEFGCKFGRFVELFKQDIYVLAARVKNATLLFGDVIKVIIGWRKSKTEDVEFVVFVASVVEIMNVVDFTNDLDEVIVAFGDITAVFTEARFEAFFLAIKIMVAETEADWRNLCNARNPGFETSDFVRFVDRFEGVD